jgi:hypothetical protein
MTITTVSIIPTGNDGFAVQEKRTTGLILGRMLKFQEGRWRIEKEDFHPGNSHFAANGMATCWVKWQERRPVEHLVTQDGQRHPDREELGDLDQRRWEPGLNGEPADPWRDTRYLHLVDKRTGAELTFITDSFGGLRAVGDLRSQIANVRCAHPGARAVVQLGSAQWKTKFGLKLRPQFHVVDWLQGPVSGEQLVLSGRSDMNDDIPF